MTARCRMRSALAVARRAYESAPASPLASEPAPRAPLRVWALVSAVWAGAALVAWFVADERAIAVRHPLVWPLLAIGLLVVQRVTIRLHLAEDTVALDLSGLPVLVGACLVPARSYFLAGTAAVLVAQLLRTRQPVRIAFNLGNQLMGMAVASLVLHTLLANGAPAGPRGWLAVVVSLLVFELVTGAALLAVIVLSEGWPGVSYVRDFATQTGFLVVLNSALTVTAVSVYLIDPPTLVLFGTLCVGVALLYRHASRLRHRFADLQALYDFTVVLAGKEEITDILVAGLALTRRTLRCRHAELSLVQGGVAFRFGLDDLANLTESEEPLGRLERSVLTQPEVGEQTRRGLLIPAGHHAPEVTERGFVDAMAVAVPISDSDTAALVVADRNGDGSGTFETDDLTLLQALAAHLGTALLSCGRLDRLRDEVAAREHEAYHDSLTGLGNRAMFNRMVAAAMESQRGAQVAAVMLMDLDGFKEINDTLGHQTGDTILRMLAARVRAAMAPRGVAARLGGDEFAFLLPSAGALDDVTTFAAALLAAVAEPVTVDGMELALRASIGVALAPLHGTDSAALLRRADVAMYASKRSGQSLTVYNPDIDHHTTRRLVVASALQKAIPGGQLDLWYQPVAELHGDRVTSVEALVRWYSPELGTVSPVEFIPVAEQSGLIEPLTWWVVTTALTEMRAWRELGYELSMAVNISARSLFDSTLADRLAETIANTGADPTRIILEITESSMMSDLGRSGRILRRLAQTGVRIAIDDFGTGYSSLSRLKELPVSVVKIDRSFVKNMTVDTGDQAIVRSTIELARVMGHDVVAEGVEDQATWDLLVGYGCSHAQGYYLAAPMTGGQFRAWIAEREKPTVAPVLYLPPQAAGA